jgi:hypothetical protein
MEILSVYLTLEGGLNPRYSGDKNSYVLGGTHGVLAVRASTGYSQDNFNSEQPKISAIETDESSSGEDKILLDPNAFYEDESDKIYPIVSKGFKLRNHNQPIHHWQQSEYFAYTYDSMYPDLYFRLVKALCVTNPDDLSQEELATGDHSLKRENCTHKEGK